MRRHFPTVALLVVAVILGACGDDKRPSGTAGSGTGGSGGGGVGGAGASAAGAGGAGTGTGGSAASNTTPVTPNKVPCLASETTCDTASGQTCCGSATFDSSACGDGGSCGAPWSGYSPLTCTANGATACTDDLNLACDGAEDCPSGQVCCITRQGPAYKLKTACAASCPLPPAGSEAENAPTQLSHARAECPTARSACCSGVPLPMVVPPFGYCLAPDRIPSGLSLRCDMP